MASTFATALITGASGFLGHYLRRELARRGIRSVSVGRHDADRTVDLESIESVRSTWREFSPDLIVNAAAMSSMGACAKEPERAFAVNARCVEAFADFAGRFVQVSTDLVFDGRSAPYTPTSAPAPLSVYGESKRVAERLAAELPDAIVVRLPLLFGPSFDGRRGATDMLQPGRELTLFTNEFRTPIHAADASRGLLDFAAARDRRGVVHVAGPERISRWEFAERFASVHGLDSSAWRPVVATDPERPRDVSMISDWFARSLDEAFADCALSP